MHIEKAFGQLVWWWGILWRPLGMPFAKRPLVVKVAFFLHNFCRRNDYQPEGGGQEPDWASDAVGNVDHSKSGPETPRRRSGSAGSELRRRMTKRVENCGRRSHRCIDINEAVKI